MEDPNHDAPITLANPVRLLRQMNHDLRNSLNTILLTIDLLDEGAYEPLHPQQAKAVKRMKRTAQRLLVLTDDIADYVKAEANQYPLTISTFALQELAMEIVVEVKAAAIDLGVTIQLVEGAAGSDQLDQMMITSDQQAIRRIVLALLWNAISFSTDGPVQVRLARTADGAYQVFVKDDGQGIEAAALTRMFELFWRGANDRKTVPTSGFGTGMAAAKALAAKINATLAVAETNASGSTFVLTLPSKLEPAVTTPTPSTTS